MWIFSYTVKPPLVNTIFDLHSKENLSIENIVVTKYASFVKIFYFDDLKEKDITFLSMKTL